MGKGDKKSRRGKIWRGSFGKTRPKKNAKSEAHSNPKAG
jgi:30S ribosomal protein S31